MKLGLVVVLALLVGASVSAGGAGAATYQTSCPDPPEAPSPGTISDDAIETRHQRIADAAICEAIAERLETLVSLQEAAIEDETTTQAQRVALAPVDRNRLDLMWWGTWAIVGTLFALMVAPMMQRAFRWWRE